MLALIEFSDLSTLDEELERLKLEVWFVVTLAFIRFSELSTLDELFESVRLLV